MAERIYTWIDQFGVKWRMEGSRPISEIGDEVNDKLLKWIEESKKKKEEDSNLNLENID